MKSIPKELILNGDFYNSDQLQLKAQELQKSDRPEWENSLGRFLEKWIDETDTITVKTSGSTGIPKPIGLSKKAMLTSASMTGSYLGFCEGQTALLCLNSAYIAGMMMVVRALTYRMNLITVPPDGSPLNHISGKTPIDFTAMVPAQVFNTVQNPELRKRLESIGILIIGGAEINHHLEKEISELSGRIYATFGMTETITHIALRKINGSDRSDLFTVLPGISISTDDRNCLIAGVPYLDDKRVITNDLVTITSPVTFRWIGRGDNVINSGGFKLIPEIIEKKIADYLEKRFFMAAIPDPKLGQIPVIVIETQVAVTSAELNEISETLNQILRKEEMPRRYFQSVKFEETATGKIIRTETLKKAQPITG